jgi:hypothetical protein
MIYMLLIKYDPSMPFEGEILQPKHAKLEAELRAEGKYVSGAGLQPVEAAGTWRVRGGKTMKTDGPFAETKEVLGGYFMVDCDEEEALKIAERIAVEKRSWIDVHPVFLYHPNVERIKAMA